MMLKNRVTNWIYLMLKLLIILVIILCIDSIQGCRDPYDFEPPEDSLLPAPDPPQLLWPRDSIYYHLPNDTDSVHITFNWSTIEDIEFYEWEIDTSAIFSRTAWSRRTEYDTITFGFTADDMFTKTYYWHVRAASDLWFWWTEWSETRTFIIPVPGSLQVQCKKPKSFYLTP